MQLRKEEFVLEENSVGLRKPRFIGIIPGHEKFAFMYGVIAIGALAVAIAYWAVARLDWFQCVLVFVGCLAVGWAMLYTVLEVRRLAQTPSEREQEALEGRSNPYISRSVSIEPSTGDPYPHHEEYRESCGQDQGQRTSRLPGSTPLIDDLLRREREAKR